MNIRKKALSLFAMSGLLMGMTGGLVAADSTTGSTTSDLKVTCDDTISVDVDVTGQMVLDIDNFDENGYDSEVASQNLNVKMDLGCRISNDFSVTAEIGVFRLNGTSPLWAFSGDRLVANNGTPGIYTGPTGSLFGFPAIGAPEVQGTMFPGGTSSGTAMEPETIVQPIIPGLPIFLVYDKYSSGEMNGSWDMQLQNVPAWVYGVPGTYTAPLTVTLNVN